MPIGDILKGALAMLITAALIVGVAYIFQLLPSDLKFPSVEFGLGAGISIAVFGAAIAGVGLLVSALTPAVFGMGALGVLVAALVIVGVAWIFTLLPESIFKPGGLIYLATDALVYFGTGVISLFEKFGNALVDVGLKFINGLGDFFVKLDKIDLFAISAGIAAIAGSMALLAGSLMGSSISGVVSGAANAVSSVLNWGASLFTGEDPAKTPQGFLEYLIKNQAAIALAGGGIKIVADNMKSLIETTPPASAAMQNFVNLLVGPKKGTGSLVWVRKLTGVA
jgi:hypothetical protein